MVKMLGLSTKNSLFLTHYLQFKPVTPVRPQNPKLPTGEAVKIIFVPSDKKRGWIALLSTDTALADEEIVRQYGKRWDIEVFFKMCKQHLKLVKEIQIRDFDGLIGNTSMV